MKGLAGQQLKKYKTQGINQVEIVLEDQRIVKLVGNNFVDAKYYLDFDPREAGINERVHYPVFKEYWTGN